MSLVLYVARHTRVVWNMFGSLHKLNMLMCARLCACVRLLSYRMPNSFLFHSKAYKTKKHTAIEFYAWLRCEWCLFVFHWFLLLSSVLVLCNAHVFFFLLESLRAWLKFRYFELLVRPSMVYCWVDAAYNRVPSAHAGQNRFGRPHILDQ